MQKQRGKLVSVRVAEALRGRGAFGAESLKDSKCYNYIIIAVYDTVFGVSF